MSNSDFLLSELVLRAGLIYSELMLLKVILVHGDLKSLITQIMWFTMATSGKKTLIIYSLLESRQTSSWTRRSTLG